VDTFNLPITKITYTDTYLKNNVQRFSVNKKKKKLTISKSIIKRLNRPANEYYVIKNQFDLILEHN